MANKTKFPKRKKAVPQEEPKFIVKINSKTTVNCRTQEQVDLWKMKYPEAEIKTL